jgi:hypothetical protein
LKYINTCFWECCEEGEGEGVLQGEGVPQGELIQANSAELCSHQDCKPLIKGGIRENYPRNFLNFILKGAAKRIPLNILM